MGKLPKHHSPILAVEGLTVQRGEVFLLRDVNWQMAGGEHWVVLGANGSGKTSLLKVLNGYLALSRGTVEVLGEVYGRSDWRDLRKRIGLVSSALQASIPAAETVLETVVSGRYAMLDLWQKPTVADREDAQRHLRTLRLLGLVERPWLHLSQGERQRVLIARALMARPEVLILDEPCAGLDPVARQRFLKVFERLARSRGGPALVLVTHHVEEITPAFTHGLVLRRGRVLAQGPLPAVMNSATLSAAFGASVKLRRRLGCYALGV